MAHAVSLQVNSETDFVARNEQFVSMVGRIAAAALKVPPPTRQGRVSMTHESLTPSSRSQAAAHGKRHVNLTETPLAELPAHWLPKLRLPNGAFDCRADGVLDVDAVLEVQTEDGTSVGTAVQNVASVMREKMALRRAVRCVPAHCACVPSQGSCHAYTGAACCLA